MRTLLIIFISSFLLNTVFAQPCILSNENRVTVLKGPIGDDPSIIFGEPHDLSPPVVNDLFEEDRVIGFVHGLGGSPDGWVPVAADIDARYRAAQVRPTYSQQYDLFLAGEDIHVQMGVLADGYNDDLDIDPKDNFLIGHSQGGLVSRAAYMNYIQEGQPLENRNFGGIVTLCSPHKGAQFLNIVKQAPGYPAGVTPAGIFADNAIEMLSKGPVAEEIEKLPGFLVNLWGIDETVEKLIDKISNIVTTTLLPIVFGGNNDPISNTYTPGAPQITEMNNFGSLDIPSVAFYAKEVNPLIWRSVHWLINDPADQGPYQATDAIEEEWIEDKIKTNIELYHLKMHAFNVLSMYQCNPVEWTFFPEDCTTAHAHIHNAFQTLNNFMDGDDLNSADFTASEGETISKAYGAGYQWFLRADDYYKLLVGQSETVITHACDCVYQSNSGPSGHYQMQVTSQEQCEAQNNIPGFNCTYSQAGVNIEYVGPSDGSVLMTSALGFPGANNSASNVVDNAFHMQARNHPNLKIQLDKLLSGDMAGSSYFKTKKH